MNNDEFRRLTEEARNANLVEFFRNNGFTVQRMGSEYRVPEYGLMINPDKHLWNCFYTDAGGGRSSIDCVIKVLGLDIHEELLHDAVLIWLLRRLDYPKPGKKCSSLFRYSPRAIMPKNKRT